MWSRWRWQVRRWSLSAFGVVAFVVWNVALKDTNGGHLPNYKTAWMCADLRDQAAELEDEYPGAPSADEMYDLCLEYGITKVPPMPEPPLPARSAAVASAPCKPPATEEPTPIDRRGVAPPDRPMSFFARRPGRLPGDGRATVAGVRLPEGRRCPHYWATNTVVPNGLDIAARLAEAFPRTGLWPVLWGTWSELPDEYAWSAGDPRKAEGVDVEGVLNRLSESFGLEFDGLAEAAGGGPSPAFNPFRTLAKYEEFTDSADDFVVLLVPVQRPADAVSMLGLIQPYHLPDHELTAVVRSWEERYGATVTMMGLSTLGLAVDRPRDGAHDLGVEQTLVQPDAGMGQAGDVWYFEWPD